MKNQMNEQNKFNVFKCSNCGSSDYTEVSHDVFQCNYCGSKIENDNTVTDKFISFIDSTSKAKKNIYLVESLVSKEQFFKRALIYMSSRQNSPEDVLNVRLEDVKMSYAYYFILDVNFNMVNVVNLKTSNRVRTESNPNSNVEYINMVNHETELYSENYSIAFSTNDTDKEHCSIMLKDVEMLKHQASAKMVSNTIFEKLGIVSPNKSKIEKQIITNIENTKIDIMNQSNGACNRVVHKINNIDMYIVPIYSLEYKHKNQKYKISSFAYDLNINGTVPKDDDVSYINKENKIKYYPILSVAVSAIAIIFSFIQWCVLKSVKLIPLNITLVIVAFLSFYGCKLWQKIALNRLKNKTINAKTKLVNDYLASLGLTELNVDDKKYIKNFIEWGEHAQTK